MSLSLPVIPVSHRSALASTANDSSHFSASRQLHLSSLASLADYRANSVHQRFRVPTQEIEVDHKYKSAIPEEFIKSTTNNNSANSSSASASASAFSRTSVSSTFGRPNFTRISSSGDREIRIPYESRLGLKSSARVEPQPAPKRLFTHESPILREFFDHGNGKFISENGINVAQCYYHNRRPLGGRMKTDIGSRATVHGYRFTG